MSFQPRMSPSLPVFNDLLLAIYDIFELRLLTCVLESLNKTSPSCFHDFLLFSSSDHLFATRQASEVDLYRLRKNCVQYGLTSIRYLGAKLWNALPVELRNALSQISSKSQLKIHFLIRVEK